MKHDLEKSVTLNVRGKCLGDPEVRNRVEAELRQLGFDRSVRDVTVRMGDVKDIGGLPTIHMLERAIRTFEESKRQLIVKEWENGCKSTMERSRMVQITLKRKRNLGGKK